MRSFIFCLLLACCSPILAHATMADIETAVMEKDYATVKELSSNILKSTADSKQRVEAEYYFGLAQLRLGQYAQARQAFQIVMEASAKTEFYDKAALGMIESLYLAGFYKDALKEGERLVKKSPNSASLSLVYLKIARANLKMMRWSQANEYLSKILKDFPQSMEAPIAKQLMEEKEYFTVQVGSFVERGRAMALINQLKSGGQYAYVVETTSPDGKAFYRVRVGQMTSLTEAKQLEQSLAKLGYPTLIYP